MEDTETYYTKANIPFIQHFPDRACEDPNNTAFMSTVVLGDDGVTLDKGTNKNRFEKSTAFGYFSSKIMDESVLRSSLIFNAILSLVNDLTLDRKIDYNSFKRSTMNALALKYWMKVS